MKIKDKSVLYGIALVHLSKYVHNEKLAKKQYSKAKKLSKEHKRKMKLTDGISINGDIDGVLANEDLRILNDLDLISDLPNITNFDNSVKLLNEIKKAFENLF